MASASYKQGYSMKAEASTARLSSSGGCESLIHNLESSTVVSRH